MRAPKSATMVRLAALMACCAMLASTQGLITPGFSMDQLASFVKPTGLNFPNVLHPLGKGGQREWDVFANGPDALCRLVLGCVLTLPFFFPFSFVPFFWLGLFFGGKGVGFFPDGRLLVCLQAGRIIILDSKGTIPLSGAIYADLARFAPDGIDASGERGLMDVRLDPNFPTEPFVWIFYGPNHTMYRNNSKKRGADM
jgi:hypothetical protein